MSLSQQLAAITNKSSALIDNMKQSIVPMSGDCADKALMLIYSKRCVVGRCTSQYATPVQFFKTRCHYTFHHPTELRVDMDMSYKDMTAVSLNDQQRTLSFLIPRPLGENAAARMGST